MVLIGLHSADKKLDIATTTIVAKKREIMSLKAQLKKSDEKADKLGMLGDDGGN
jgi:hypothetical protein